MLDSNDHKFCEAAVAQSKKGMVELLISRRKLTLQNESSENILRTQFSSKLSPIYSHA